MKNNNYPLSAILGAVVGDAMGVPVEFQSRKSLSENPVVDMRGYGSHNQPSGTWSDDTSMTLCLLDSLANGLDYDDIMQKFLSWTDGTEYTPHGKVFDIGKTVLQAIYKYPKGIPATECGGKSEWDNGNGSLMRILPLAFHFGYGKKSFEVIHNVSSLTHSHKRSQIACGIYLSIVEWLLMFGTDREYITNGIKAAKRYYESQSEYAEELKHFERLFKSDFKNLPQDAIKSSGYVVDTLEAVLWCLLNTDNYESCILKAVNLGQDTDTIAAIAGGLAGMYYGADAIPPKWLNQIARLDYIKELCEKWYPRRLCSYIPFFENIDKQELNKVYKFEGKLWQFVCDADNYRTYCPRTVPRDYNKNYGFYLLAEGNTTIKTADLESLRAILDFIVYRENEVIGSWVECAENGLFLEMLKRLRTLAVSAKS
ncbi:hypothetical protein tpqmel_0811 [Candidatus Gastranaerophilus sp. (ex Termes propinquus)]|nr:hypothetical protein tpqmel_0811 [Candidatus Gastranaerophilus sp. (ex Termes propinquus)]